MMICSQCGNDLAAGSAVCPNCGAQMAGNVAQPAGAAASAGGTAPPGTAPPGAVPPGGGLPGGVPAGAVPPGAGPAGPGQAGTGPAGAGAAGPGQAAGAGPAGAGAAGYDPAGYGPQGTGPAAGGPAGRAAPSFGGQAFKFDLQRLSLNDRIVGIATVVLFISLFLPWFSANVGIASGSVNGLFHGYMYITLIVALAVLAYLVLLAGLERLPFKLPVEHSYVLLIGTGINFLLTLISFIFKPASVPGFSVGWAFGAFVGLIAAVVAVVPEGLPFVRSRIGK